MRYCGKVGFSESKEAVPGVWIDGITERTYYGDVLSNKYANQSSGNVNDNILVNNIISIMADAYFYTNLNAIKYIEWFGTLWRVSNVEIDRPRVKLTLGGVYNGPVPG